MSDSKRVVVYVPEQLLEQVDVVASKSRESRSEIVRAALTKYVQEERKYQIRKMMQQGYQEMGRLNLCLASEAFSVEQEAGGTVERLVSGG
ncbi:CopG family ribbon-helix-helix protein [Alicyclobacillus tolerans]|uniref:CopG family transcriptional regulator / antitoxin EndoAI n=2 Tax=Alicyclobacillus tolerans TaxID=90970 RepID=A0A1M6N7A0_9BACL|nr:MULTISPECIES: ribbon-helix-helix protein, CopG family [Alicyclobacillus]MDP9728024.1 CopG family transcriptional regulator/antitoxin EndoAI [Alicyclobacillus tengchongensis]SHJ91610.1 CopG family transcriptional regulator / antitoxin EndoAI [Alicyclobacillus montanus]